MQRTKIDWADYSINPVKGLCPMACSYCYARRMYRRYHWDETVRLEYGLFHKLPQEPARVFVGSTMELFGDWVKPEWMREIFERVNINQRHTFIFLTKRPENLQKWSPFPKNCWVGVSATNEKMFLDALESLDKVKATVRFISAEPMLESFNTQWFNPDIVQWLIVGQQTPVSAKTMPRIQWVKEIVQAADSAKIPVFLKNNLDSLVGQDWQFKRWVGADPQGNSLYGLRQEYPRVTP